MNNLNCLLLMNFIFPYATFTSTWNLTDLMILSKAFV